MIRINQLKFPIHHTNEELQEKIFKTLKLKNGENIKWEIFKRSIDARKKPDILYVYIIHIFCEKEEKIVKRLRNHNITLEKPLSFSYLKGEISNLETPPIIVGAGPAGLFCAYYLAKAGLSPLVIERGETARKRKETVDFFWKTGKLNSNSNVQFGEGGAGTFSDGKLNTLVKDTEGRNYEVLKILVEFGAPKEITYEQKPHLGTDLLIDIVENMRKTIESLGGRFLFNTKVEDFIIEDNKAKGVVLNNKEILYSNHIVVAIGHSARDTFETLYRCNLTMHPKSFAVGLRMEHLQEFINLNQYGAIDLPKLGAAPYKLTQTLENDRSLYSFCMCPGGYVVNASSEEGYLAVNGMSYHDRGSKNANSAMIVTVSPEDYKPYRKEGTPEALMGVDFQRELERVFYELGNGKIPVQTFQDFCNHKPTNKFGKITPCMKGEFHMCNLRDALPKFIGDSIEEGIHRIDTRVHGFANGDALLSGIESRTSSPVRIERYEDFQSSIKGIFPCGEGAGYAGGITSAAMDGIKIAEKIAKISMKSLDN